MHIAVIGAGITGVSSALALSLAGHRVEVFEQQGSIAAGGSFAGAGVMLPMAFTLLAPPQRWPLGLLRRPASRRKPSAAQQAQGDTLRQLAAASAARLNEWREALHLEHEHHKGWTLLLRSESETKALSADLARLQAAEIPHALLDAHQARSTEPALSPQAPLHAALHLPAVTVLNPRQLTQQLRHAAQRAGARFHLDTEIRKLIPGRPAQLQWQRRAEARTDASPLPAQGQGSFDAIVLCTGPDSSHQLRELSLKLPLRTLGGCSLTAPLSQAEAMPDPGPRGAVTDAQQGITLSRLGDRIRATALWAEPDAQGRPRPETLNSLYRALDAWFPGAARHGHHPAWQGLRSQLPDGAPALGASGLPGLWLNLGHGDHGTSLALGCAEAIAAMITGSSSPIDCAPLSPQRWH